MNQFSFQVGNVGMALLIEKAIFSEYQVIDQVQKTNNQITHEPTNHDHTNG
jgi:hypothetical protein